jgi:glycosyltransferase involved in cell wall biosynthesis
MHILITTAIYPPDIGGPASYIPKVAAALHKAGHTITVVTMADGSGSESTLYGKLIRVDRRQSVLSRKVSAFIAVAKCISNADIVYANGLYEEILPLMVLPKRKLAKVVGDWAWERMRSRKEYNGTIDFFQIDKKLNLKGKMVRALRNVALLPYKDVVVPSSYLASIVKEWQHIMPRRIHIIHNGISIPKRILNRSFFNRQSGHRNTTICTVCRLVPWKHVDEIIRCVAELPDTRLIVVGDGPERDQLEKTVSDLAISNRIMFRGVLLRERTLKEIAESDIVVLNSDYEGLPHVLLEAMALGKPIIAKRSGGSIEIIKNNEVGCLVSDAEELRKALTEFSEDSKRREKIGSAGRQYYRENFTEHMMLSKTEKLIEELRAI